ncbi:ATP-binding cassette domain-containing protein, partial [Glaesserella parasuis]|nr:ATP-binding cassette domain-containing protein [Glaesserella parasuis]
QLYFLYNPIMKVLVMGFSFAHILIQGANGAGKSTFLRTLLGTQAKLHREIFFANQPLVTYSPQQLAQQIAYVPQAHQSLFPFTARRLPCR